MKTIIFTFLLFSCLVSYSQKKKAYELYFDSGNEKLLDAAKTTLDSLFNKVPLANINSVNIYGYCDSIGKAEYNLKLSVKRAETVKNYIKDKGIPADSIYIKGYGKENPKYSSLKWNKNRRVSIELNFKKKTTKKEVTISNPVKPVIPIVKDSIKPSLQQFVTNSKVGDKIALRNITFYGGSDEPLPPSFKTLDELVKTLKNNPNLEINIEGHICCQYHDENDISGHRARAVYDYLIKNGIKEERLSYKGFGHRQPLTQERTEAEQQMNRRVEIRIVKK